MVHPHRRAAARPARGAAADGRELLEADVAEGSETDAWLRGRMGLGTDALFVMLADGLALRAPVEACALSIGSDERLGRLLDLAPARAGGPRAGRPGTSRCLRITPDGAIAFATSEGHVAKVDPLTGARIDSRAMDGEALVAGRRVPGRFVTRQSVVLHGDHVYVEGMFRPDRPVARPDLAPTCLLRLRVAGPTRS